MLAGEAPLLQPGKPDKGRVRAYLGEVTGLSWAQLTQLIAHRRRTGHSGDRP